MKILVITTYLKNDLVEAISKNVIDLCCYIGRYEDVTLLIPSQITTGKNYNFNIINYNDDYNYESTLFILKNILKLRKWLKNVEPGNYDIVHYHLGFCIELFLIKLIIKKQLGKTIATIWQPYLEFLDVLSLAKRDIFSLRKFIPHLLGNNFFLRPLYRFGFVFFDKIVVSSHYQECQLKKTIPQHRICRISNGIIKPKTQKYNKLIVNKLLYVGHYTPSKGVDDILKCLFYLKGQIDFSMTFALSDRGNKKNFYRMVKKYGLSKYIIQKNIVDVYDEMNKHDLFIMPYKTSVGLSYYPNVVLECFAVGLPIIATSIEVMKELISEGKNGVLVPIGNSKYMAKIIIDLLANKNVLHEISICQKKHFGKKFTLEKSANAYMNLYKQLKDITGLKTGVFGND